MATTHSILLIDGDTSTRDLVRSHLGSVGKVTCVTTGRDARRVLERSSVDVLITEAQLPDGSGIALLQDVRRAHPRLLAIIVTGFGSEALCAQAFRAGVHDYFPKPVDAVGLTHTVRWLLHGGNGRPAPGAPLDEPTMSGLRRALRYIHDHYTEKLGLADVANAAGVSYFTTSRMLSGSLGVPFQTYLHRLRVDQAKRLLASTELGIAAIGTAVGFGDLSRFNKSFLKYAGMTPTAYRRHVRGRERTTGGAGSPASSGHIGDERA